MQKRYKVLLFTAISFYLTLTLIGCGAPGYSYYIVKNGTKTPCNGFDSNCGSDFYEVNTANGTTYHCTDAGGGLCNVFQPTTLSAVASTQCIPKYVYENLVDEGQSWVVVSQQQDQNNSSVFAQATFVATTSKTVTVTDKRDVIANLHVTAAGDAGLLIGVITADVKAEIDHEVTQTVTTTIRNAYNVSIPSGLTAYANYGVKVRITSGHLYDKALCSGKKADWGIDITYVPVATGWCVWLSNQPPCSSL